MMTALDSAASLVVPTRWCPRCREYLLEPSTLDLRAGRCVGCAYTGPLERPSPDRAVDHRRRRPRRNRFRCAARPPLSPRPFPSRLSLTRSESTKPRTSSKDRRESEEDITRLEMERHAGQARELAARAIESRHRRELRASHRLEQMSKRELYRQAAELGVHGRSKMSKDELIAAIRERA